MVVTTSSIIRHLPDHAIVVQINDRKLQKVKVITAAGARSLTQTFDISGLEFVVPDET